MPTYVGDGGNFTFVASFASKEAARTKISKMSKILKYYKTLIQLAVLRQFISNPLPLSAIILLIIY